MRFDDSETDHDFCFQFKQKIQYFKDQQVKAEALKRELEIEEEKALEYQEEMPQVKMRTIVKLLAKSLHYNHRDHPPLTFKSLRGDLYSSVIHHWNRQLKPY